MKKGFALIVVVLIFGGLIVVGSGIVTARFILNKNSTQSQKVATNEGKKSDSSQEPANTSQQSGENSSLSRSAEATSAAGSKESLQASTVYTQPQNLYSIATPKGWTVNPTTNLGNYTTTKFTATYGNISITSGSGKDPIGGCSEKSSVVLADRTIPGCFLLQKDGSKFLTRGYTKAKSGLEITIEAYINSPNTINLPIILEIIKTIDIN